ncbi:MAG: nicotinate-nucleotide--dimethylbenzimidazole phosphoribosyltransferase [Epsilonproteobacteria bacterium]|nr:nicotinate-nucleotide--dimethylbenzimidazole phosphoribosyltransferase [Campylobacterota bacterium]
MKDLFNIEPVLKDLESALKNKIDNKTKPIGSLGKLEELALQIGCIQNTLSPKLNNPTIIVFAGDHGIAGEGVSAYPQEVTEQMVLNFLNGGAAINVFCRQNDIALKVVDAGVNADFESDLKLINAKIGYGTKNFLYEPAMSISQAEQAIKEGAEIVKQAFLSGCNIIGFGDMGIGDTSSASIIMSLLGDIPINECTGRGAGLDDEALKAKETILANAVNNLACDRTPISVLSTFGGFEIAMMSGAMLQAAALKMILLIDGFIVTSALLAAFRIDPNILDYCIFTHRSNENGHTLLMRLFNKEPLLDLGMRLGEGTGAALAYPIVEASVNFLNEMASFESANVSKAAS